MGGASPEKWRFSVSWAPSVGKKGSESALCDANLQGKAEGRNFNAGNIEQRLAQAAFDMAQYFIEAISMRGSSGCEQYLMLDSAKAGMPEAAQVHIV